MKTTDTIRNFYKQIIGYVETDSVTGEKTARDFYKRILGYYDPKLNVTRDFYKRIVAHGDALVGLIYSEDEKQRNKNK